MVLGGLVLLTVLNSIDARVRTVDARWGGAPVPALVAAEDGPVGASPVVRRVALPPAAVPGDAATELPDDVTLALPLPRGAVVTHAHLDARGPGAGLPAGLRAVPIPVEPGWGVTVGGWVDVWVLGGGEAPARQVAAVRPVIELRDDTGVSTALIGLEPDEVREVTTGLSIGRVLLAHAPAPRR